MLGLTKIDSVLSVFWICVCGLFYRTFITELLHVWMVHNYSTLHFMSSLAI